MGLGLARFRGQAFRFWGLKYHELRLRVSVYNRQGTGMRGYIQSYPFPQVKCNPM